MWKSRCAAFALTILSSFASYSIATAQELTPVDLELVLAVDISGSVDDEEARLQRNGYVAALQSDAVVRAVTSGMLGRIAVTYLEYAGTGLGESVGYAKTVVGWTLIEDAASAARFAKELAAAPIRTEVWTSISRAIEYALPQFAMNAFEGTRQVIDVSGDGPNNNGSLVTEARAQAKAQGVTVNGLPIINGRISPSGWPQMKDLDLYYKDCVITGPTSFIVVANSFQDFARAIRRKLILEIANATPATAPSPTPSTESLIHHAAVSERPRVPCDAGEKRIEEIWETY
jgi:hypothetical protein